MATFHSILEQQVQRHLNVSTEEFEYLTHPAPQHLHDPFYYKNMRELVTYLRRLKQKQEKDENLLLVVRSDYDTDGILASVILTAALSVFEFRFRVYIPSMEDGYGLSAKDIDKIKAQNEPEGYKIGAILTADNGIASFSGISYAKQKGIDVLVTDHHPSGMKLPKGVIAVDPWVEGDQYPFKKNSGATVAWKTMLAYAEMFEKEKKPLIERLIVFAGISNIADVMPVRNENRYMVKAALGIVDSLKKQPTYKDMADTIYPGYNTAFHGLFDLISLLQQSKDAKRAEKKKRPVPLPKNEELFSWYLGPLLNAPRRVHDTCLEGMMAFLVSDMKTRQYAIRRLIELNEEKSELRDKVLKSLGAGPKPMVLCVNTRKGISGLIAEKLAEESSLPSIVFSIDCPEDETIIYENPPKGIRISGSARSNPAIPLDRIMEKVNKRFPNMLTGGGHATAAGFSVKSDDFQTFQNIVFGIAKEVYLEVQSEAEIILVPENSVTIYIEKDRLIAETESIEGEELRKIKQELETKTFCSDMKTAITFLESLRPYGEGYLTEPTIKLVFDQSIYSHGWDPSFWKTFKCNLYGVEILTFDEKWANQVKTDLEEGRTITAVGKLKLNEFRGTITPQIQIGKGAIV